MRVGVRTRPATRRRFMLRLGFSKVLYIVTLHSKCTMALNFEIFCFWRRRSRRRCLLRSHLGGRPGGGEPRRERGEGKAPGVGSHPQKYSLE